MCRQIKGPTGKAASNTGWSGKQIRIGRTQGSGRKIRQTNTLTTIAILSQETNEETQKKTTGKSAGVAFRSTQNDHVTATDRK